MKRDKNKVAWIAGVVAVVVAGLGLGYGVVRRVPEGSASPSVSPAQAPGAAAPLFRAVPSGRGGLFDPVHRRAVVGDGDRFPDAESVNREPPMTPGLAEKCAVAEGEGATVPALAGVLREAVKAGHGATVSSAGDRLVALGDAAVPELMTLLNSGDRGVEAAAFSVLSRIGTGPALAVLIGRTLAAPDPETAAGLEQMFASIRSPAVTETLIGLMNETDQPMVKAAIGSILSSLEGGHVVDALTEAAGRAENPENARDMKEILASLNKPSNIPDLERALLSQKDPVLREAVVVALATIGNARACEVLARYADDPNLGAICLEWLATVNSPYGQQALLELVAGGDDSGTRAAAATALGNYASSDLIPTLQRLAGEEADGRVRTALQVSAAAVEGRIPAMPPDLVIEGEQGPVSVERAR